MDADIFRTSLGGGGEVKALARFFHIRLGNSGSSVTDTSDASKVTFIA